jgi:hypothetical protein
LEAAGKGKIKRGNGYAWQSILAGRELLNLGCRWRIGDGRSVAIWRDKWILKPTAFTIQSPCRILSDTASVGELIEQHPLGWKTNLIRSIFNEEEDELVCNLPLG